MARVQILRAVGLVYGLVHDCHHRLGQVVRKLVNANPESQTLNVRGPKNELSASTVKNAIFLPSTVQ